MIEDVPVLGIVVARGGSVRLPGKNIKSLAGKPLIAWTIEAAKGSKCLDRVILSSDDENIIKEAKKHGCEVPFLRPDDLSGAQATASDVVCHALEELKWKKGYVVLLQPTSPLRTAEDIDACVLACYEKDVPVAATISEMDKPINWAMTLDEDGCIHRLNSNEDRCVVFPNGMVYVADVNWLLEHKAFWVDGITLGVETPGERAIDIDTQADFDLAEFIIQSR